jgi:hypothetical protein
LSKDFNLLDNLKLLTRTNQCWDYSGLDSPEECIDKKYFSKYQHKIEYVYNSRGFRDYEWPDSIIDLQESVWCVGDSFTVGLGQPFNHIWPQVLQQKLKKRTINISMDGASNDWIFRRSKQIITEINPKILIIMWSYLHRRENINDKLLDEDRRLFWEESPYQTDIDDYLRWKRQIFEIREMSCKSIHLAIPNYCPWLHSTDEVIPVTQLDWARDYYHFDIKTSEWVVNKIFTCL